MIARWRALDRPGRLIVAAGTLAVALGLAAIVVWWHTYWAQYVVQNMLPPSVWTLVGLAAAHLHHEYKADQRHEDLKQHVSQEASHG